MCNMDEIPEAIHVNVGHLEKSQFFRMEDVCAHKLHNPAYVGSLVCLQVDWEAIGIMPIRYDPKQPILKIAAK